MDRRDFLKGVAITGAVASVAPRAAAVSDIDSRVITVSAFNYDGVRLKDSDWKKQYEQGRDFYLNVNNDDILHGYRLAAGMPAIDRYLEAPSQSGFPMIAHARST